MYNQILFNVLSVHTHETKSKTRQQDCIKNVQIPASGMCFLSISLYFRGEMIRLDNLCFIHCFCFTRYISFPILFFR